MYHLLCYESATIVHPTKFKGPISMNNARASDRFILRGGKATAHNSTRRLRIDLLTG